MNPALMEIARRVSNWGRWGADDERGTVNLITPEVVQRAARCVRRGQVFSLGLELGENGPQFGQAGRVNPLHIMTSTSNQMTPDPAGLRYADDVIVMPLQCATQWDSLAHVHYGGQLYNGHSVANVTSSGAAKNGIDKMAAGIVSRGVLLDVARVRGVESLGPGEVITPEDLEAAERAQNVRAERGDVLLVRTGYIRVFTVYGERVFYMKQTPGLGDRVRRVAACARGGGGRHRYEHGRSVAAGGPRGAVSDSCALHP